MLSFADSFSAIVVALVVSCIVGLLIVAAARRAVKPRYIAAFALGIYFWFFSDTIGDTAYLDASSGFSGGIAQTSLFVAFAIGLLFIFYFDRDVFRVTERADGTSLSIPLLLAFAVGFHGFGEGAAFSATAASTLSTNLLDAFGGLSAAEAFILHKLLEPMMIGAAYWLYAKGRAVSTASLLRDILLMTFAFTLPGIIGGATDYFLNYDVTYLFAFGLGTSLYAPFRLAKPLFSDADSSRYEAVKLAFFFIVGFASLYIAALLHA